MLRKTIKARPEWTKIVESQGLLYHTIQGKRYWDESAYYEFTGKEAGVLEQATAELHGMCLHAVDHAVQKGLYERFRIPDSFASLVETSWKQREPELYGRFDFIYARENVPPKLLEYNADTPTSLPESALIQKYWRQERFPEDGQLNRIDAELTARWQTIARSGKLSGPVHFTCVDNCPEDLGNTVYLSMTAERAGLSTDFTFMHELRWNASTGTFRSVKDEVINALFKLYPWEWLFAEPFGQYVIQKPITVFEPAWKILLSNKMILVLLWELFPKHPNLLPAYPVPDPLHGRFVKKPIFSREGANIQIFVNETDVLDRGKGPYGKEGYVYQAFSPLPEFDGNHVVLGSWVIGGKPAGIGIREDESLITKNSSRFLPHIVR